MAQHAQVAKGDEEQLAGCHVMRYAVVVVSRDVARVPRDSLGQLHYGGEHADGHAIGGNGSDDCADNDRDFGFLHELRRRRFDATQRLIVIRHIMATRAELEILATILP